MSISLFQITGAVVMENIQLNKSLFSNQKSPNYQISLQFTVVSPDSHRDQWHFVYVNITFSNHKSCSDGKYPIEQIPIFKSTNFQIKNRQITKSHNSPNSPHRIQESASNGPIPFNDTTTRIHSSVVPYYRIVHSRPHCNGASKKSIHLFRRCRNHRHQRG
jgi:hypothetical protein